MHSAINYEATLDEARTGVAVSGPIQCWEVGERNADFCVRIVQGDIVAAGRSPNWKFDRMDDEWEVVANVSSNKKLAKGYAYAEYWAKVRREDGSSMNVHWPVYSVRLK